MKKILILISLSILTYSCDPDPYNRRFSSPTEGVVCNCKEKEKLAEFIKSSIKNSNNMSDEEMEDVIYQLEKTGLKIICKTKTVYVFGLGYQDQHVDYAKTKLDTCETVVDF